MIILANVWAFLKINVVLFVVSMKLNEKKQYQDYLSLSMTAGPARRVRLWGEGGANLIKRSIAMQILHVLKRT